MVDEGGFFRGTLELLADAPPEYKLSGLAIALLFFVFWRTASNPRALGVIDRSLNQQLRAHQLFGILKIGLLLGFLFSIVLVVLAFVSPIWMKREDTRRLHEVTGALEDLREGRYSASRTKYRVELAKASDEASADEIRGMITATYYGQGLHREGLQFVCDLYQGRAPDDHRYIWAIHAHLRRIRLEEGLAVSREVARDFRTRCRREDFSGLWPLLPLGLMERLHDGRSVAVDLSDADAAALEAWLTPQLERPANRRMMFSEYGLYAQGKSAQIADEYPNTPIRDVVLRELAENAEWPDNATYFEDLVEHFDIDDKADIYKRLATIYAEQGDLKRATSFVDKLQESKEEALANVVMSATYVNTAEFIQKARFADARAGLMKACDRLQELGSECDDEMTDQIQDLDVLIKYERATSRSDCRQVFMYIRKQGWLSSARSYLDNCLQNIRNNPTEYGKALYQAASISRSMGDYGESEEYLERFRKDLHAHPLLDDVYAELIWHYTHINEDPRRVDLLLRYVATNFEGRNGYDNSLYDAAYSAKQEGRLARAARFYFAIATGRPAGSIYWSRAAAEELSVIERAPFFSKSGITSRMTFVDVRPGSVADQAGVLKDDRLVAICTSDAQACVKPTSFSTLTAALGRSGDEAALMIIARGSTSWVLEGSLSGDTWERAAITRPEIEAKLGRTL